MAIKTHKDYAAEFGVTHSVFTSWLRRGAPYQNRQKMITWLLNMPKRGKATNEWLKSQGVNPVKKRVKPKVVKGQTAEDFRDHYKNKLQEATLANDQDQVKFWSELFLKQDESIRRSEAHAAKLGIDNGTTLARAEVERILRAVFYAGNGCVNGALATICEHVAGFSDPGEVYHSLKPAIVGGRLFSGFDKVANIQGAPALPDWVIECVKHEAEQYLANSESLWTKKLK